MQIHHYHPDTGLYLGAYQADESPLEPGVYLVPAHATENPPPPCEAGERAVWAGDAWRVETIPIDPVLPDPPAPTLADIQTAAVMQIKAHAGTVILARLPSWKQANLTARALELLAAGETGSPEWAAIQAQWTWVKSVRAASDNGEVAVLTAQDIVAAAAALADAISTIEAVQ